MKLSTLNEHAAAARLRVDALEDDLTAAYLAALRSAGRKAAARFRGAATPSSITAATNPWVPPDPSELLDQAQLAAQAQKKVAPIHERALRLAVPVGISFDLANPLTVAFLDGVAQRSAGILGGFGGEIGKAIGDAYEQGLSVPKAAQLIRSHVDSASEVQARLLARSDLVSIANGGSLLAAQIVNQASEAAGEGGGPSFKTWLTAGDERVRDDHAEADGQTVPLDQPFDVGGESLQYPGDPSGSLEQTANCRCTQIYGDSVTAAAGPDVSKLAMVAVHPLPAEAAMLAVDGGQGPETLHVTLLFLGDAASLDEHALNDAVAALAKTLPPLEGEVGGAAHFAEGPDGYPSILLPDVKGLSTLQEAVRATLADAGIESPSEHGFLPHMTLDYSASPDVPEAEKIGSPLHFDNVSVVVGGAQTDYPLTGDSVTAAARAPIPALSSGGTMTTTPEVTAAPVVLRDFHLTAAAGEPTRWQATLLVEDEPTEDGRMIAAGAATWRELPLPLAILDDSSHSGVGEAPVCGRIDQIWRAGNAVQAAGVFDTGPVGVEAERLVRERMITGISCDGVATESEMVVSRPEPDPEEEQELLDEVAPIISGEPVPDYDEDLEYLFVATAYTIMGATICPAQAIAQARISVVAAADGEHEGWRIQAPFSATHCEVATSSSEEELTRKAALSIVHKSLDALAASGPPLEQDDSHRVALGALTASVDALAARTSESEEALGDRLALIDGLTVKTSELERSLADRLRSMDARQEKILLQFAATSESFDELAKRLSVLATIEEELGRLRDLVERKPRQVEFKRDDKGRLAGLVEG